MLRVILILQLSLTAVSMRVEQYLGPRGKIVSSRVYLLLTRSQTPCKQQIAMGFEEDL